MKISDFPLQNASKRCVSPLKCIKVQIFPFKLHQNADFPFNMHENADFPLQNASKC